MKRDGDSDPLAETAVPAAVPRAASPVAETLVPALAHTERPVNALDQTAVDSIQGRKSFEIGTQLKIGRFVVLEKLGEGGMGLVLAAFDPQLDRRVAIKMLHDHVSESQGTRLEREAKAMAQLSHPNVLTVHETGLFGDRLYIAMELVDGQTLGQWLRAKPRTHDEIFEVVMQAGRGLAAAHAVGLVHRDFKPDNVLVGHDGRVRVSDFGLVSSAGEMVTRDGKAPSVRSPSSLTQTGAVMGTPLYMAPEQHDGRVADAKADQFSFCVTLWQALCEELPYGADTYEDLVDNVTGGKLRPIPRGARVPAKVRAILQRGLAADPAERFASMHALLAALDRARRPLRWPWLAGGGAVIAGGGITLALLLSGDRDPCASSPQKLTGVWDAPRKAQLASTFQAAQGADVWKQIARDLDRYTGTWIERHREVCRATHVRNEQSPDLLDLRMRCLDSRLTQLDALLARFAETKHETLFKAIDATAGLPDFSDCDDDARLRAAIPLPTDPAQRTRIAELEREFARAVSYDKTGDWTNAKQIVDPLIGQARLVGYAPLEAKLVLLRAGLEYRAGDLVTAAQSYRESTEISARARDDERIAQSWIDLMNVLAAAGKYADALALEQIARTSTERVSDLPRIGARFANVLAGIHLAQGKYPEAKAEYEKALAFVRKDGPDSDLLGPALTNLGTALWYVQDLDGASKHLHDAKDRFLAKLGPRHPSLGYIYRNLGDLAANRNKIDDALALYIQSRQIFEGAHGPDHIDVAIALEPLSYAYARKGDSAKAREAGEKALAVREQKFGLEHPSIATALNSLADAEMADGKPAALSRALAYLDRALAIQVKTIGAEHPKLPETIDRIGEAASKLGKHDLALTHYQRSLAIRTKVLGARHNDTAYAHLRIAEAQLAARKHDAAAATFEVAEGIFTANDPKDADVAKARFGRARARLAAGKRAEALSLANGARDLLASNPDGKPLVQAIDTWLATAK